MHLLIAGATGLVGGHVLRQALDDARIAAVVAPVRRALPPHPKLHAPVVDFDRLPEDAPWWAVDAAICTIGTTMRTAGSRDAFEHVDHDLPLAIARAVHAAGARTFAFNSAKGADAASPIFYNRTKGATEQALRGVGFASLTLVRPGLIGGERAERRTAEHLAGRLLGTLHPLLPRGLRINPAETIAHALLDAALAGHPGVHLVESAALA